MSIKQILNKIRGICKRELTPYGYIRNFILFPICGFFRSYFSRSKNNNKIRNLKNKFKDERCFIIATGPSLTVDDVNKLKNEHTIGVNSIFRLYDKIDWRPEYYMILDAGLCDNYQKNGYLKLNDFAKEGCFLNSVCKYRSKSNNIIYLHTNWLKHVYKYGNTEFKYCQDLVFGLYDFYSVTHAAIQVAIYMGFKEIYFIGVDNNYMGSKTHFVETKGDDTFDYQLALKTQTCMDAGYEEIRKIADARGVKVYNATRGGKVKAFDRVNLDDII